MPNSRGGRDSSEQKFHPLAAGTDVEQNDDDLLWKQQMPTIGVGHLWAAPDRNALHIQVAISESGCAEAGDGDLLEQVRAAYDG